MGEGMSKFLESVRINVVSGLVVTAVVGVGTVVASTLWNQFVSPLFIPPHAVMAFNEEECPRGWLPFADVAGRVIVGSGQGADLTNRPFRDRGGAETHTLTVEEMPIHSHPIPQRGGYGDNGPSTAYSVHGKIETRDHSSGNTGRNEPHNNMPPYIALYFCKKN